MSIQSIIFTILFLANLANCTPKIKTESIGIQTEFTSDPQLSETRALVDQTTSLFFCSAIYSNNMYALITRALNAELAVLEANKSKENINHALNKLKTLCHNISNFGYSEEITLTQIVRHMQTPSIENLPAPYSKNINYNNPHEKKSNISQSYNTWLARAIKGNQKNDLSIFVRNFNTAISDNQLPDALWFIKKTMEELRVNWSHNPHIITIDPNYNDIMSAISNLSSNDMQSELLRSMFTTYMLSYKEQNSNPWCVFIPCKLNVCTILLSLIVIMSIGLIIFSVTQNCFNL